MLNFARILSFYGENWWVFGFKLLSFSFFRHDFSWKCPKDKPVLHPQDLRLLLLRMAFVNFFFWLVCFRFPVTKRSTVRCVICQLRSTRGDGPWLHQTETSYPTFISTTQQSDTPPPATTETAGGKSISQVLFEQYFLWKKRHHPSLRNCKLGNWNCRGSMAIGLICRRGRDRKNRPMSLPEWSAECEKLEMLNDW